MRSKRRLRLTAADAHGDDAPLAAGAVEAVEERRGELRARAAERVAERDRAAVRVEDLVVDPELALDVDGLAREGLVDLGNDRSIDLHPVFGEELAMAGTGPMPMMAGSTPTVANARR